MKKLLVLLLIPLMAASCLNRAKKAAEERAEASLADSLKIEAGYGAVVEDVYEGTLPAADTPGQVWVLTFYHQEFAPHGVYHLNQTFLEAENGKDKSFESSGTWVLLEGEGYPHPVYVLTDYADGSKTYFRYYGQTIEMLDRDMQPAASSLNYTLKRQLQDVRVE